MTKEELIQELGHIPDGKYARVPYDVFDLIFPPGIESDKAKQAAYDLAKASGCVIENRPDDAAVWFVRAS